MSAAFATWLAMLALLLAGIIALVDASHELRRWRIAPALLCGASGFWLADRSLAVLGMATTAAQVPAKAYLPAIVVLASAVTLLGLLWRHRNAPRIAPDPAPQRQKAARRVGLPPLRGPQAGRIRGFDAVAALLLIAWIVFAAVVVWMEVAARG